MVKVSLTITMNHQVYEHILLKIEQGFFRSKNHGVEWYMNLGLKAEECLMIDDAHENIKAAKELGMHAIQFKSLEDLKKQLELHGVRA